MLYGARRSADWHNCTQRSDGAWILNVDRQGNVVSDYVGPWGSTQRRHLDAASARGNLGRTVRFDGAIFDVDGVLVDSPHERAWRESFEKLMAGPWRNDSGAHYQPGDYMSAFYQTYVAGKPRKAGARAAIGQFGISDLDGRLARQYAEAKQDRLVELIDQGDFRAFEDALRFLLAVKTDGVRAAVASELSVPAVRAFVVEDAPSGVQAAKSGGMACFAVARLDDEASLRSAASGRRSCSATSTCGWRRRASG